MTRGPFLNQRTGHGCDQRAFVGRHLSGTLIGRNLGVQSNELPRPAFGSQLSAVTGSIILLTSVTIVAGNPLRSACS